MYNIIYVLCVQGGYKLDTDYIRNCDKDSVLVLSDNFTVKMTDDCKVYFNGCITAKDNITSAEVKNEIF